jgi:hypothetical protein
MIRIHLFFLLLGVHPLGASAQARINIPSRPSCRTCRIELVKLFTLGGATDTLAFDKHRLVSAVADSRGIVYVAPTAAQAILAFSSRGKLLGSFGRKGKGPGEFFWLQNVEIGPRDSVFALDHASISVFSPDRKFVRRTGSLPSTVSEHVILPRSDFFALTSPSRDNDSLIAYFSPKGELKRRYPPAWLRVSEVATEYMLLFRALSYGGDNTLWVARHDRYEIERRDTAGNVVQLLTRIADWWPKPSIEHAYFPRERRPEPELTSVHQDAQGLLWVTIVTGKAAWKQLDKPKPNRHRPMPPHGEWISFFETVVEVLDPQRGTLLATRRFPFFLNSIRAGKIVIADREDEDGNLLRDIYRIELRRD